MVEPSPLIPTFSSLISISNLAPSARPHRPPYQDSLCQTGFLQVRNSRNASLNPHTSNRDASQRARQQETFASTSLRTVHARQRVGERSSLESYLRQTCIQKRNESRTCGYTNSRRGQWAVAPPGHCHCMIVLHQVVKFQDLGLLAVCIARIRRYLELADDFPSFSARYEWRGGGVNFNAYTSEYVDSEGRVANAGIRENFPSLTHPFRPFFPQGVTG